MTLTLTLVSCLARIYVSAERHENEIAIFWYDFALERRLLCCGNQVVEVARIDICTWKQECYQLPTLHVLYTIRDK